MVFGRKGIGSAQPQGPRAGVPDGHRHVLEHLERGEDDNPHQRTQLAGAVLFDLAMRMIKTERGVRVEDLLGALSAVGGLYCAVAAVREIVERGSDPSGNEIVIIQGNDGRQYIFGDLPNRYLLENPFSLLSLAMGAAHAKGATISLDDATSVFSHVAGTAGGEDFGKPRLPATHQPFDTPIAVALNLFGFFGKACAEYEVSASKRPEAFGFALQRAIDAGASALDPQTMIKIVIEYAVPAARIAPGDIANWEARLPARSG